MAQTIDILETRLNTALINQRENGNTLQLETGIISLRQQIATARAVSDYETLLTYTEEQAYNLGFDATFHGSGPYSGNPYSEDVSPTLFTAWCRGERDAINEIVSRG